MCVSVLVCGGGSYMQTPRYAYVCFPKYTHMHTLKEARIQRRDIEALRGDGEEEGEREREGGYRENGS